MLAANTDKARSVLLYVVKKIAEKKGRADFMTVFKTLYFADKKYLADYGRTILGDTYIAMNNGPVPSFVYETVKRIKQKQVLVQRGEENDALVNEEQNLRSFFEAFEVSQYYIAPKIEPDMGEISRAELTSLDEACEENYQLSFGQLSDKSHDAAWKKASKNGEISVYEMARSMGASEELIKFIADHEENSRLEFLSNE